MPANSETDPYLTDRERMVEFQVRSRGVRDLRVLQAMARVPRHEFIAEPYRSQSYEDHPIPIGLDQTISQPYIVALVLESLNLQPSDIVLEIGTGSGYQTALLSELAAQVYSMERHEPLARQAEATLARLGYRNITVVVGDGSIGLPQWQPYDAILVSAAAPTIPEPLFQQLAEAGRMVLPVGPPGAQELQLVRNQAGIPIITSLGGCAFVPLIGEKGQPPA